MPFVTEMLWRVQLNLFDSQLEIPIRIHIQNLNLRIKEKNSKWNSLRLIHDIADSHVFEPLVFLLA